MARKKKMVKLITFEPKTIMTLQMLGFDVGKLANELLERVAGTRQCPLCGRELRPKITARPPKEKEPHEPDEDCFLS